MPSIAYTSVFEDMALGRLNFATDAFKAMLVSSAYVPNKDTHTRRSNITNEVVGTGYVAGGAATVGSVTKDLVNDRIDIAFTDPSWTGVTLTARGAVVYKDRGGAASADELVGYIDFGSDFTCTNGPFTVQISIPLRLSNPL